MIEGLAKGMFFIIVLFQKLLSQVDMISFFLLVGGQQRRKSLNPKRGVDTGSRVLLLLLYCSRA